MASSLPSQLQNLINPESTSDDKTIKTPELKVIANTLLFENTVYQISNISTLELADLTTVTVNQIPQWYWFVLGIGVVTIPFVIGIFLVGFFFYLLYNFNKNKVKVRERYGLRIGMNSGSGITLASRSREFVLKIIIALYSIMNSQDRSQSFAVFNFETEQLVIDQSNRSISVDKAFGSVLNNGSISGNIVNNVK